MVVLRIVGMIVLGQMCLIVWVGGHLLVLGRWACILLYRFHNRSMHPHFHSYCSILLEMQLTTPTVRM
jgi:hypothetical protein